MGTLQIRRVLTKAWLKGRAQTPKIELPAGYPTAQLAAGVDLNHNLYIGMTPFEGR